MAYCEEIQDVLVSEAKKEVKPLVAHTKNYPDFNQQDVKDTATTLIDNQTIRASFHFHYKDLCTITFAPNRQL